MPADPISLAVELTRYSSRFPKGSGVAQPDEGLMGERKVRRFGGWVATTAFVTLLGACATITDPAEILDTLAPACRGEAIPGAAEYVPSSRSMTRLVLLQDDGEPHRWTAELPRDWTPSRVSDVGLVACAESEVQRSQIEECTYVGGDSIRRYVATLAFRLVAARTGEVLMDRELRASPRECQSQERADLTVLSGQLEPKQLIEAIAPDVEGRVVWVEITEGAHLPENAARAFRPAEVTVSVGNPVRWVHHDSEADSPHTIQFRCEASCPQQLSWVEDSFTTSPLLLGETLTFEFTAAGTYLYESAWYPSAQGKVIVTPAN